MIYFRIVRTFGEIFRKFEDIQKKYCIFKIFGAFLVLVFLPVLSIVNSVTQLTAAIPKTYLELVEPVEGRSLAMYHLQEPS